VQKFLDAGPDGFVGGVSAGKYVNITGAAEATATRDLAALAGRDVLAVPGRGRASGYRLTQSCSAGLT